VADRDGVAVSGFGITATFAAGAVTTDRLIILGNWPNGLDVTPPTGTIVKTLGLQECNTNGTACTSELGNFPNSPAGIQRLRGQQIDYTAGHPLPDVAGNTNFGTTTNKLVTITANTGANRVYVYNANNPTTATAYPKLLDSTSDGSTLTFRRSSPSSGRRPPRPIDRCTDAPVTSQAPGRLLRMISRQQ
jgi:hypothetical protein